MKLWNRKHLARVQTEPEPTTETSDEETSEPFEVNKTRGRTEGSAHKAVGVSLSAIRKISRPSACIANTAVHYSESGPPRKRRSNRITAGNLRWMGTSDRKRGRSASRSRSTSTSRAPDVLRVTSSEHVATDEYLDKFVSQESDRDVADVSEDSGKESSWSGSEASLEADSEAHCQDESCGDDVA